MPILIKIKYLSEYISWFVVDYKNWSSLVIKALHWQSEVKSSQKGQFCYYCFWKNLFMFFFCLTLKRLDRLFLKRVLFTEKAKHWFLVTFNIITSHSFPENLAEIYEVVQKIWKFSASILTIFVDFSDYFIFPSSKETNGVRIFFTFNLF